jgi:hypothetical protein
MAPSWNPIMSLAPYSLTVLSCFRMECLGGMTMKIYLVSLEVVRCGECLPSVLKACQEALVTLNSSYVVDS